MLLTMVTNIECKVDGKADDAEKNRRQLKLHAGTHPVFTAWTARDEFAMRFWDAVKCGDMSAADQYLDLVIALNKQLAQVR